MPTADVLILDATNIACLSGGDAAAFEAWVAFLNTLLRAQATIAVFDAPKVRSSGRACLLAFQRAATSSSIMNLVLQRGACLWLQGSGPKRRQEVAPEYLQLRKRQVARKVGRGDISLLRPDTTSMLQQQQQRQRQRQRLHALAERLGCHVLIAPAEHEADDLIQALCGAFAAGAMRPITNSKEIHIGACTARQVANVMHLDCSFNVAVRVAHALDPAPGTPW